MEEYYPYTVIPQKVKSTISEQIPLPKLPKLLPSPDKVKRSYWGIIIFALTLGMFIAVNLVPALKNVFAIYCLFFLSLIALVAMIFEFVKYGKLKKHYQKELHYYEDRQKAYKKVKEKIEQIKKDNENAEKVEEFRQEKIHSFFEHGYDIINAVHNKYSPAKERFKLFLEEYFPDEILDDIKIVHRAKKINYVPDFIIQFNNPKINIAIEIEEPYSLSYVPENIQKDYEAKDRLRQRFANELAWFVIILSEEQAVLHPTECCRFIEDSMAEILHDIRRNKVFANIKPIKKQKILSGKERAKLKANKYREIYLTNAGLINKSANYDIKKHIVTDTTQKTDKADKPVKQKEINNKNVVNNNKQISDIKDNKQRKEQKTISSENDNKKETKTETTDKNNRDEIKKNYKSVEEIIRKRKLDIQNKLNKKTVNTKSELQELNTQRNKEKASPVKVKRIDYSKVPKEKLEVKVLKTGGLDDEDKVETTIIDKSKTAVTKDIRAKIIKDESTDKQKQTVKESEDKAVEKQDKKQLKENYHKQLESAVFDKKWDELIKLCNKAIKEFPDWDWAYYRRSTAFGHKKAFYQVKMDCNKAIKLNNNFAEAYYNRASANFFIGKYTDAIKDYDRAIFLDYVKIEEAYFNKGLSLIKLNRLDDARKEFLKAKELGCQKSKEILKKLG